MCVGWGTCHVGSACHTISKRPKASTAITAAPAPTWTKYATRQGPPQKRTRRPPGKTFTPRLANHRSGIAPKSSSMQHARMKITLSRGSNHDAPATKEP